MLTIYLAGGLFNAAERTHNLLLEKELLKLGRKVILPQREALKHCLNAKFDLASVRKECRNSAKDRKNIYVGNADGADADSGTCVEYGIAIENGEAIVYRTDFRTDVEREIGVNGMLMLDGRLLFICLASLPSSGK